MQTETSLALPSYRDANARLEEILDMAEFPREFITSMHSSPGDGYHVCTASAVTRWPTDDEIEGADAMRAEMLQRARAAILRLVERAPERAGVVNVHSNCYGGIRGNLVCSWPTDESKTRPRVTVTVERFLTVEMVARTPSGSQFIGDVRPGY